MAMHPRCPKYVEERLSRSTSNRQFSVGMASRKRRCRGSLSHRSNEILKGVPLPEYAASSPVRYLWERSPNYLRVAWRWVNGFAESSRVLVNFQFQYTFSMICECHVLICLRSYVPSQRFSCRLVFCRTSVTLTFFSSIMAFTHLYFRLETLKTQQKVDQLTKRPKTEAKGVAIVEIYLFRSPRVCTAIP